MKEKGKRELRCEGREKSEMDIRKHLMHCSPLVNGPKGEVTEVRMVRKKGLMMSAKEKSGEDESRWRVVDGIGNDGLRDGRVY
jgi:hypothetical protein